MNWWPGETPFEVMAGAILTQNTAWRNVERALERLRKRVGLDPRAIARARRDTLERALRPAGYFRQKARRLKAFCTWLIERWDGRIQRMRGANPDALRSELLSLNGIGPETADSILLYALGVPTFVVDAYTRRVLKRHGFGPHDAAYDALRAWFESHLPRKAALYNEFHALFVAVGKERCRAQPLCAGCPLEWDLRACARGETGS
jgi:endonuclease-3 related protein